MRRVFCVVLCLVLLFVSWAFPASAVAVVDDIAAAAIAVLAAVGMTFVFSGLSASGALNKVSGLLDDYAGSIGESVAAWLGTYDITMFGGKLRLAAGLATKLYGFANWVKNNYDVMDNTAVDVESIPGSSGLLLADGKIIPVTNIIYSSGRLNVLPNGFYSRNTNYDFLFASGARVVANYDTVIVYNANGIQVSRINYDSYSETMLGFSFNFRNGYITVYTYFYDVDSYFYNDSTSAFYFFGNTVTNESSSVGIEAGVISIPVDSAVDDVLVDVGAIPIGTTVPQVTDIIIDNALAGTLEASIEETADLPPVVPPEAVGDFTIDLTNFFPFCIPFDVYDAITLFSAAPVAPNMPLKMTWEGTEYGFDIDLSPFDTVAAVLRRMEIIVFIVGLAVVTRRYIKW